MGDHILHITEVTKYGTEYDLECVGHDKKTCNLQTWWFNEWDDLLKLDPIDIPIPVRAEWNNSDEPTIVLAAVEPAVTITWDGSGKTLAAIREHLPADWGADIGEEPTLILSPQGDYDAMSFTEVGENWRIEFSGDSFAVLPPEEVQS